MTAVNASPFRAVGAFAHYALCALTALVAITADATAGQLGTLDPFWANGSTSGSRKLITALSLRRGVASTIAVQPDGKVLVAGFCQDIGLCAVRYSSDGTLDIDGDTQVLATSDALIHARIALDIRGDAVVAGITFSINAQRKTGTQIRGHLVTTCGMTLAL